MAKKFPWFNMTWWFKMWADELDSDTGLAIPNCWTYCTFPNLFVSQSPHLKHEIITVIFPKGLLWELCALIHIKHKAIVTCQTPLTVTFSYCKPVCCSCRGYSHTWEFFDLWEDLIVIIIAWFISWKHSWAPVQNF